MAKKKAKITVVTKDNNAETDSPFFMLPEENRDKEPAVPQAEPEPDYKAPGADVPDMSDDDIFDLIEQAKSKKKKLEYIEIGLLADPNDLDLALMKIQLTKKDEIQYLQDLESLLKQGEEYLRSEELFDEVMGEFWLVLETRPYMRVYHAYLAALMENGMMLAAMAACRRMLELCRNDNLGIRYYWMHLCAYLMDETAALTILNEHGGEYDTQMYLPLSMLYFKLGKFETAQKYLKQLTEINKDTKKFLSIAAKNDVYSLIRELGPYGFRVNSIEELAQEFLAFRFLFISAPNYAAWAGKVLKRK